MTEAILVERTRRAISETAFIERVVWRVPFPVPGSPHDFKYRLALVVDGVCVLRYDNEAGKGDHRHVDGREEPYRFIDVDTLQTDFMTAVEAWRMGE